MQLLLPLPFSVLTLCFEPAQPILLIIMLFQEPRRLSLIILDKNGHFLLFCNCNDHLRKRSAAGYFQSASFSLG